MKRVMYYLAIRDNKGPDRDYVKIAYSDMSVKIIYRGEPGFTSAWAKAMSSKPRNPRGVRP